MKKAKFQKAVVRDTIRQAKASFADAQLGLFKRDSVKDVVRSSKSFITKDGYQNLSAQLGVDSSNQSGGGSYNYGGFITRNRQLLDAAYRTSWIVGKAIDSKAEDMTKAGILISSDELDAGDVDIMQRCMIQMNNWKRLTEAIKWGRLYGGSVAIILIEGQSLSSPLNVNTIGKGAFKGLLVLDRWLVDPSLNSLVQEYGPDFGLPKYYNILASSSVLPAEKVHHTRVLRFEGVELPYLWKQAENLWSESVIERLWDRLLAFDSTTQGAAQLVFKAHLRVVGVEGLREILAAGGVMEAALIKQFQYIRQFQTNEGITLLDSKDEFNTHQYSFSGLDNVLLQFGQQLSGALDIPLVRLFGQSPTGMNSTGESDLRTYYDGINKEQEQHLKEPLLTVLRCLCMSELSKPLPDNTTITFNPLWQMDDKEKVELAKGIGDTVVALYNAGIYKKHQALSDLKQASRLTGQYSNITDEDIEEARNEPDMVMGEGLDITEADSSTPSLESMQETLQKLVDTDKEVHASMGDK